LILSPLWSVYAPLMIDLTELSNYSKDELLSLWHKLPTRDKPPKANKVLLRELAYRLQEQAYGKLDKNTKVSLRRHMTTFSHSLQNGNPSKPLITNKKTFLEVGSQIVKEWRGESCVVKVLGKRSFEYNGKMFKSLSAVAKIITGQHVSGPLFFGLKK